MNKNNNDDLELYLTFGFKNLDDIAMRESIKSMLEDLEKSGKIVKGSYSVKRTKLPRKLKKKFKKDRMLKYTITYIPVVDYYDILVDL